MVRINDSPLGPNFIEPKVDFTASGGTKNGGGATISVVYALALSGGARCGGGATIV